MSDKTFNYILGLIWKFERTKEWKLSKEKEFKRLKFTKKEKQNYNSLVK